MAYLVPIIDGLCRHNSGMRDARPDGKRDQAAVLGGIASGGDQKGTQDGVEPADHLQVITALSAVPQPARRPNQAQGIDEKKYCAESHERNLQELLTCTIVHANTSYLREIASGVEKRHARHRPPQHTIRLERR